MKKITALLLALVMLVPAAAFAAAGGDVTETVIADYKMNADEGLPAGNLVSYSDPTQGTYYKNANNRVNFALDTTVTEGILIVEYDFNNLANSTGGNYNKLHINNAAVEIYNHRTWDDTGSWVHYKHEIDIDAKTITTYKAGATEGDVVANVAGLATGFSTNSISLDSWHSMGSGIDNLVVTHVVGPVLPCRVIEAKFEGSDGVLSSEVSEIRTGVVALNVSFSGTMNQSTVNLSLLCDENSLDLDNDFDIDWIDDRTLRIAPKSGEFECEAAYTLTIFAGFADIKGGTAEEDYIFSFECINFSGVVAYYDMETDIGGISGAYNTREFVVDENGNTYLDVYNDWFTFMFDETVTGGTLTAEFDYKNIDVDNNLHCAVKLDTNGVAGGEDPKLFQISGSVGSGEWVKYKMIADIDNDEVEVYRDGVLIETVTGKGINNLSEINGLGFERWSRHTGIDNIKVYYGNSGIENYKFRDFSGKTANLPQNLVGATDCIAIEFENEPDVNTFDITLYNERTEQFEEVVLTASGRILEIRTDKGYFDVSTDYIISLSSGYKNKFGYVGTDVLELAFNTGDKVFGIVSVNITKNGTPADLDNISNGDLLAVEITYVLTTEGKRYDAIVALTTESSSKLNSFGSANATFNRAGVNVERIYFTIDADSSFDTVYAYVWDLNTRVPYVNCAVVK